MRPANAVIFLPFPVCQLSTTESVTKWNLARKWSIEANLGNTYRKGPCDRVLGKQYWHGRQWASEQQAERLPEASVLLPCTLYIPTPILSWSSVASGLANSFSITHLNVTSEPYARDAIGPHACHSTKWGCSDISWRSLGQCTLTELHLMSNIHLGH